MSCDEETLQDLELEQLHREGANVYEIEAHLTGRPLLEVVREHLLDHAEWIHYRTGETSEERAQRIRDYVQTQLQLSPAWQEARREEERHFRALQDWRQEYRRLQEEEDQAALQRARELQPAGWEELSPEARQKALEEYRWTVARERYAQQQEKLSRFRERQ